MTGTDPAARAGLWGGPAEQMIRALIGYYVYVASGALCFVTVIKYNVFL